MRTDPNVSRLSFRHSDQWRTDPFANIRVPEIDRRLDGAEIVNGRLVVHSLSGSERNHLFINRAGKTFDDLSLISGIDTPADSRGFVTLDYDRDGLLDIALVNANHPLLNLFQNQMSTNPAEKRQNRFIALRFVGANHNSVASSTSTRDGYGALVEVNVSGATLKREHRCGEGYGAQNSAVMIVGLGDADHAEQLTVRWPSGKASSLQRVAAGSFVTAFEDTSHSTNRTHFDVRPYSVSTSAARKPDDKSRQTLSLVLNAAPDRPAPPQSPAKLKVHLTMATWCTACVEHLPHLRRLAAAFSADEVELIGVPVDPEDSPEALAEYHDKLNLPYRLITELTAEQRRALQTVLGTIEPPDAIPATVVTDASGRVRYLTAGAPTVSDLRKLLAELPKSSS